MLPPIVKTAISAAAQACGATVLSQRAFDELRATRRKAIAELAALEEKGLKPGLTGVVFSCDRALQVYSLIATYLERVKNPAPLTVQYRASTPAHAKAYKEVEAAFATAPVRITFVPESKFRDTLPQVLASVPTRNMFFLVDDIVIIRPLDLKLAADVNPTETILSLRLSPHMRRSYTANVAQMPPSFKPAREGAELLEFAWFKEGNEWSYPYSVDGHVFSTAEIRVLTRLATFKAPNTYEGALMEFQDLCETRRGLCYTEAKILNLPLNRVQDEVQNIAGDVSPEFLLEQWNKGLMLDTSSLRTHTPRAPHEEHPLTLKKRPDVAKPKAKK